MSEPERTVPETETLTSEETQPVVRRRVAPMVMLLSLAGVAPVVGFWMTTDEAAVPKGTEVVASARNDMRPAGPDQSTDADATTTDTTAPAADVEPQKELSPEDAERARLIVGVWEQERYGTRRMTVNEDGTASMVLRPAGLWATMFGNRIDLDMYWKVRDGHIDYGVSGGSPKKQMEAARSMWGDHWVEKIEALSDGELVLLDQSTSAPSKWTRIPESELTDDSDETSPRAQKPAPEIRPATADERQQQ